RAVAISMADGPAPALALIDTIKDDPALKTYHFLPVVRGELLEKLGRTAEARSEFERAASLTHNQREQAFLQDRAARLAL
ncbi:MAG TPA: RNA polymerase subunit sigma-24, partial [Devosia sp.]|nr:RNA polymerase subunit sigma-24 [Devosia sp.]